VDAPRAQILKKEEKPAFCATLPRPTGRAPPNMSEDSKSKSEGMSGRVLGEESGRSDAAANGHAWGDGRSEARVSGRYSDARVTFRAEL